MYGNFTVFTTRKTLDFPKFFCLTQVIVPVFPSAILSVTCRVCGDPLKPKMTLKLLALGVLRTADYENEWELCSGRCSSFQYCDTFVKKSTKSLD